MHGLIIVLILNSLINSSLSRAFIRSERTVIVHLFEWKWNDIADECERFLGPHGFAGVQISPPNEHAIVNTPFRPWWERYQPVSYKLISRSGNEQELINMIKRCKSVGVRVYADVVINHMSALNGIGSAGSYFNAKNRSFPAVPYNSDNFNDKICTSKSGTIESDSWNDPYQVRNCRLLDLPDLTSSSEYVQKKISDYLTFLAGIGIAGFRIDAAKHIWPADLYNITKKFQHLRKCEEKENYPFIYQEVHDDGSGAVRNTEYTSLGHVTEFKYGYALSDVILGRYNQKLSYLSNFGSAWSFLPSEDALVFIDNQDTQRDNIVLTYRDSRNYKIANAFMLAWPYGYVRLMSSYDFPYDSRDKGPPCNKSGETLNVKINKDGTCGNGWICEHRWRQIKNMVKFRNKVEKQPVENWWDNGNNQIAFSRGHKGFIAVNNENIDMNVTLKTGLSTGTYCDVISGNKINNSCTGQSIYVGDVGTAEILIEYDEEDPVIAIHVESKLNFV